MKFLILACFTLLINEAAFSQTIDIKSSGCMSGDCLNGPGKYIYSNGDKFNGYWKNGIRNEYGRYDWNSGCWYLGDFRNDSITGNGAFHPVKGDYIDGTWENGKLISAKSGSESEVGMTLPPIMKKEESTQPIK